ncbi:hypothetical protein GUITHDRAFT_104043 [Guillardia theta CCMP2712]|uniref:Calmodulin n=1 Tax=Guillardia theta (strain CCMP2712) TaxID=905079 RepID=L1JPN7_GUITC|nr:hypothetical protein GUITHDRAFT_104043 [Guillardia theta CCMP2712]EKX50229.1 hypothetical protein GUITHDRAFT_104043 [Guillardia theta CCMP2712]|eukprot:XP_005837209.1 hypothetical protein GUITHDRAFT_104043 [Guillardia theta CCMP2712]
MQALRQEPSRYVFTVLFVFLQIVNRADGLGETVTLGNTRSTHVQSAFTAPLNVVDHSIRVCRKPLADGKVKCRSVSFGSLRLKAKSEPVSNEIDELNRRIEEKQNQLRREREEARKRKEERRMAQLQNYLGKPNSDVPTGGKRIIAPKELEILDRSRELWSSLPFALRSSLEMQTLLGQGSFGMVLKARVLREADGRVNALPGISDEDEFVAVKLMKSRKGEEPILMREGLILSLIDSPHVPRASIPLGFVGHLMQYVDGVSLDELIEQEGALESTEAIRVAQDLIRALNSIHSAGFIYRDLKPQNVIRSAQGGKTVYRLIDFGSATGAQGCLFGKWTNTNDESGVCTLETYGEDTMRKIKSVFESMDRRKVGVISSGDVAQCFRAVGVRPSEEQILRMIAKYDVNGDRLISLEEFYDMFGELVAEQDSAFPAGTYAYMSPEQLLCDSSSRSVSTDFYSLGVLMYKVLTGKLPYSVDKDLTWKPGAAGDFNNERGMWEKLMRGAAGAEPPTPSKENPNVPARLCQERYSCLSDMSKELKAIESVTRSEEKSNA